MVVAGDFGAGRGASAAGTELPESGCSATFVVLSARQPRRESARTARIAIDSVLGMSTSYQTEPLSKKEKPEVEYTDAHDHRKRSSQVDSQRRPHCRYFEGAGLYDSARTVCSGDGGERQRQVDAAWIAGGAGHAERRQCPVERHGDQLSA